MNNMVKKRVAVTIREDLVDWLDKQIETMRFHNRSHGIEYALQKLKQTNPNKKE
jgi:Arc/MetJ-type ribon-helix-helix transcriptional regulator